MILRCLLQILIATVAISHAEFVNKECDFIDETDRGLQCEFNDLKTTKETFINIIDTNETIDVALLRQSDLYAVPSDIFWKFPRLKQLDVDLTQLKVIEADNFQNAKQLKYFTARFNEVLRLDSGVFSACPQLKSIFLQNNQINSIHSNAFSGLFNLEALYLDYNRMSTIPTNMLDNLPNLLHISMSYNNLTTIPSNLFASNDRLETLNLANNLLTSLDDEQFHTLSHLERVQLENNRLFELNLFACKAAVINVDNNDLREIQLNKWTKIITAWQNPVNKLILHEHYGSERFYNFSFTDVAEIVLFVHQDCCTIENLENFYIVTYSFGDLSQKNFDVNDWSCKFRQTIGYNTNQGYITNNVCTRNEEIKATTFLSKIITSTRESLDPDYDDLTTEQSFVQNEIASTTQKNIFSPGFDIETSSTLEDLYADVVEMSTTESYDNKTEKGIWKSMKKKVGVWKNSAVNKWNSWVG